MNKKLITTLIFSIIFLSLVSAGNVVNIPDDVSSFEEFKIRVLEANEGRGYFAVTTGTYWGVCNQECWELSLFGDCSPCQPGEVASLRSWHPDSMSVLDTWTSASSYCNDWLAPYTYYNQQAYCSIPTPECVGGANPGEEKCIGDEVWECSSSGVWEFSNDCDYGCYDGGCEDQQCSDHAEKKCSYGSVYWYDSCGDRQEEYERCESDEVCQGSSCVRVCEEGFVGEKLCSGNEVVQQYQIADCSTDIRTIEQCETGCENSVCTVPQCDTCSDPTAWSQCDGDSMFRTNYKCDATTNYECVEFTEDESCECGTSEQCNYDETCETNVCVQLECGEGEISDLHQCIAKSVISTEMIVWIVVGVVAFIFIIIIISLMVTLKGNDKRRKRR